MDENASFAKEKLANLSVSDPMASIFDKHEQAWQIALLEIEPEILDLLSKKEIFS